MAEHQGTQAIEVPSALAHLIVVNVEYRVLLCCVGSGSGSGSGSGECRKAVSPAGIVEHLRKIHKTTPEGRKLVQEFIRQDVPWEYNYATVPLPEDGLAPQPVIPIIDGFQCCKCPFRNASRKWMKVHGNKEHSLKRIADNELFQPVRLQTWFQDGKERYWVVDESQRVVQERRARRATIQDVGEESDDLGSIGSSGSSSSGSGSGSGSDSDGNSNNNDIDDPIVQDIENWKAEAQERRLQALRDVPVVELDSWHQFTKWNEVLSQSKHNMVKTFQYTREPNADDGDNEAQLNRVLRAWRRILERAMDTLAAADQKDALKWWASPDPKAASQRPFELPQNAKSVAKYSGYWEGMICYFMRTAPEEDWQDETGM
jgi:Orsellinic acid/F9775 biosynthesis cluster protein D